MNRIRSVLRERRERRALEAALRSVRAPEAPAELEGRLLVAAGGSPSKAGLPMWACAGVAMACVAAAAIWVSRRAPDSATAPKRDVPLMAEEKASPAVSSGLDRTTQLGGRRAAPKSEGPSARAKRRPESRAPHAAPPKPATTRVAKRELGPGQMTIQVGRAKPGVIGIAVASAMVPDGEGGWAKTEWRLVRDPRTRLVRERVTYTESGGKRRRVTVEAKSEWAKDDGDTE